MTAEQTESKYYQYQKTFAGLIEKISTAVRQRIFKSFTQAVRPTATANILDVGVTCDKRADSNFFEAMYTHPENITAVALEDASFLEQKYPGLKFVKADGLSLPFADDTFDCAVSWAVIEHVGSRDNQRLFVTELARVAQSIFITTPNRGYPVEFHTVMPFIHWLPPATFRQILRIIGRDFYASEETLNLLSEAELIDMLPPGWSHQTLHQKLLGLTSNLVVYAQRR